MNNYLERLNVRIVTPCWRDLRSKLKSANQKFHCGFTAPTTQTRVAKRRLLSQTERKMAAAQKTSIKLNTGYEMPLVGLGTWVCERS